MAQPNTPNGVPPQLRRPMMEKQPPPMQFNGVHSSQSSRDSSPLTTPRVGQIPASQLPPARPTVSASSQLPSASSASVSNVTHQNLLTQKMAQLNISNGDDRFGTSTPVLTANLQQRPSGGSAFSPIVSTSNSSSQKLEDLRPQQPQSNFVPVALPSQASQNVAHNVTTGASQIQNPGIPQQNNQMSRPVNQQAYQQVGPVSNVYQNHQQTQQQVQQTLNSNRFNNEPQPYLNQLPPAPPNVPITTSSNPIMQSSYQSQQQLPQTRPQISQTQHLFQSNSGIQPSSSSLQTPQQNQQQLRPQINNTQLQNTFQRSNTTQLPPAPVLPHQQQNIPQIPPAIGQQQFTQNRPPGPPGSVPQPSQFKNNLHQNRYPQMPTPVLAPAAAAPALNSLQQQNYYQQQQQQQLPQQLNNAMQQPNFGQFNLAQPQLQPQLSNLYSNNQQQPQTDSITRQGFNRLWGQESVDLLQNPNILPADKVQAPRVYLGHEEMDAANCSPDVFRCTMTKIPESSSLLQKSRLPLGVLIHPFKDLQYLPVIQCNVIVRCRACRTYINPFVYFVDTKRWKCNLCYRINELPDEFQYDPVSKTYGDPSRRPEIKSSTIEYIAPTEYMLRPPQPAIYLFLFDVSRLAVESGYLQSVCGVLLDELQNLPGDARTQVGIIAYDSYLHFFSLGEGLSQPHEMTVLEIDDVFLPCPENLLVNLKDRMELLVDLLTQLPNRYLNSYDNNSALGAALQAAHKMMGPTGGRVTVFQASLPNVGPGALTSREDPAQRASSEINHLNPANDFYKRLALECSGQQIAVDLFVLNSQYVDIATISGICRFSGGCVHHFPLFKASKVLQSERFERCFRRYLTRKIGFEAVMRIRCTRGLSIHTFHGNFFVRSTDLLSLPNVNPDAGFGMQVSIDENLSDVQTICFQAALLYTSSKGERRIRVHTLCLPVCATLSDVINSADQQCIAGLLAKMAVDRSQQSSLSDAREAFINVAIDILSSYKMCLNMGSGVGGLLVPKCLQLLPLYISAMLKHIAFRIGTSTRLDDRVKAMIDMKTKPLVQLIQMVYPDLYPVHNLEEQQVIMNSEEEPVPHPPHLQLTARCLESRGAFLMDTGEHMNLLVCPGVSLQFLNEALGLPDYLSLTDDMYEIPVLDNPRNQRLHQFLSHLNDEKPFAATLHVIRDNSPHRVEFYERLIEDRVENALSYHEFLQHLKTQVK